MLYTMSRFFSPPMSRTLDFGTVKAIENVEEIRDLIGVDLSLIGYVRVLKGTKRKRR